MNKYDLVIFDLDGTLLDTSEGVLAAVEYTIDEFKFRKLTSEQLRTFIGPPIQNSFANAYGLEGKILQDIATVFRERYKNVDLLKAVPYDGIFDCLARIKTNNIKLAVATYKREDYALTILNYFGFNNYFDIMHGSDHYNKLKKSDIIKLCMDESGVKNRSKVILVGDTSNDEIGACKVGIDFLGVTYGFGYSDKSIDSNTNYINFVNTTSMIADFILCE